MLDWRGVYDNEVCAFDMYFASVCSMQHHPGAGTRDHSKLSIDECLDVAVDMLIARRKLFMHDQEINEKEG